MKESNCAVCSFSIFKFWYQKNHISREEIKLKTKKKERHKQQLISFELKVVDSSMFDLYDLSNPQLYTDSKEIVPKERKNLSSRDMQLHFCFYAQ